MDVDWNYFLHLVVGLLMFSVWAAAFLFVWGGLQERDQKRRAWQRAEFFRLTRFPIWWTTSSISREMGLDRSDPYMWVFIAELERSGQIEVQHTPDTMQVPAYRGIPHGTL